MSADPLRLGTFNLQHGLGPDLRCDTDRLAAAMARVDVDVLALQEVDYRQPRSGGTDQAAVVAAATGLGWHRFAAGLDGDLRTGKVRAAVTDRTQPGLAAQPGYGVALLSRYPVTAWFAEPLPEAPFGALRRVDEPRVCLGAVVQTPWGPLCVASAHLSRQRPVATRQLAVAARRLQFLARSADDVAPAVLLGDLNMPPRHAARSGLTALATALTHPSSQPVRQVDHILGNERVEAAGPASAVALDVSDHLLLTVPVRLVVR